MNKIRTLAANEIDCRVGMVSQRTQKVSILLYKNARVDMAILDELVGPENWQRDHKEIKGNLYCGVALKFPEGWVWKWDCGVESNTEKEKGEASDSFKRACVNWGIGRELYTAPSIWIPCNEKEWNGGKPFMDLSVKSIAYNEQREIVALEIVDRNGTTRFAFDALAKAKARGKKAAEPAEVAEPAPAPVKGNKDFCPEKYPVAWKSAVERAKTTGDITRLDIMDRGFVVTDANWQRFCDAVNS